MTIIKQQFVTLMFLIFIRPQQSPNGTALSVDKFPNVCVCALPRFSTKIELTCILLGASRIPPPILPLTARETSMQSYHMHYWKFQVLLWAERKNCLDNRVTYRNLFKYRAGHYAGVQTAKQSPANHGQANFSQPSGVNVCMSELCKHDPVQSCNISTLR